MKNDRTALSHVRPEKSDGLKRKKKKKELRAPPVNWPLFESIVPMKAIKQTQYKSTIAPFLLHLEWPCPVQ